MESVCISLLKWINIYTIINTNVFIIITFKQRYVRKDPNYYDISQNVSPTFPIFIRYAILQSNTYTDP